MMRIFVLLVFHLITLRSLEKYEALWHTYVLMYVHILKYFLLNSSVCLASLYGQLGFWNLWLLRESFPPPQAVFPHPQSKTKIASGNLSRVMGKYVEYCSVSVLW